MEVDRKKMEDLARLVGEILKDADLRDVYRTAYNKPAEEASGVIRLSRRIP